MLIYMIPRKRSGRNNRRSLPGRFLEDLLLLVLLLKDFIRGRYRRVPVRLIVVLVVVAVYIVLPFDIIPDYLPGYGQVDDVVAAVLCLYFLEKDLYAYKQWKDDQSRRI